MITASQAVGRFRSVYPDKEILNMLDYDEKHYVITTKNSMYAVNKTSGAVVYFTPLTDLKKFKEASEQRQLKIEGIKPWPRNALERLKRGET